MSYSSFDTAPANVDFQKLSQTIATSIQKILQNGTLNQICYWIHIQLLLPF